MAPIFPPTSRSNRILTRIPKQSSAENGRDSALRCPQPHGAGGTNGARFHALPHAFRPLALRSVTGTALRAILTPFRNSGLKLSWDGFRIPGFCLILAAAFFFHGPAVAQTASADKEGARSISGQFIVSRPVLTSALPVPSRPSDAHLIRLEPALLAVTAERVREQIGHTLSLKGPWRGQIYLVLHPARSTNDPVTIRAQHFTSGWNYRVELPDLLTQTRLVRALTGVLLLEYANRNAQDRSGELPAWLTDGLSQQLLAAGAPEILLSTPDKAINGLSVTRLEKKQQGVDPLAGARRVLVNYPALTFEELSWPTEAQLEGEDGGGYNASAQLFVSHLLKVKDGSGHLRGMLESLPHYYNGPVAFQSSFRSEFPRPLDLEKWWALQVVNFAAHDPGPGWTLAISREKLDEILRVPVEIRTASNRPPTRSEISLQAVIRNWDPARQIPILRTKLRDLDLAQFRVARPYAVLTAEYRRALARYLGDRPASAPAPSWAARLYASLRNPSAASTVKLLDALDARRRSLAAAARPEKSVQPELRR